MTSGSAGFSAVESTCAPTDSATVNRHKREIERIGLQLLNRTQDIGTARGLDRPLGMVLPHVIHDLVLRQHLLRMSQEEFEKLVFGGRHRNPPITASRLAQPL